MCTLSWSLGYSGTSSLGRRAPFFHSRKIQARAVCADLAGREPDASGSVIRVESQTKSCLHGRLPWPRHPESPLGVLISPRHRIRHGGPVSSTSGCNPEGNADHLKYPVGGHHRMMTCSGSHIPASDGHITFKLHPKCSSARSRASRSSQLHGQRNPLVLMNDNDWTGE